MDEKKIDFLGPVFIMAAIAAIASDFAFIFLLALPIPVIGFTIALMILVFHYFAGLIVLFLIFPKLKHLIPKAVLLLSIILPLPFLTIGVVLAIILQNRIVEFIVAQAVPTAITIATGGAAAPLQIAATAARVAQTAKIAAAARTAGMATKGVESATAARAGSTGAKVVAAEKEAALGAEKAAGGAAGREGVPKQQGDTLEDRIRTRKEKLNKILEKIHEKEDRDEIKEAKKKREEEEENQI